MVKQYIIAIYKSYTAGNMTMYTCEKLTSAQGRQAVFPGGDAHRRGHLKSAYNKIK